MADGTKPGDRRMKVTPFSARTIVLFAFAAATTACMSRVRPTTYFVRVNALDSVARH